MSDTTPIVSDPTPPPLYTQGGTNAGGSNRSTATRNSTGDAPPPYTPYASSDNRSSSSYEHVIPPGAGYQKFETEPESMITIITLGPDPIQLRCPYCDQLVVTDIEYRFGTLTFVSAGLCFLFCVVGTFLPFCIPGLQDVEHRCPHCHILIGRYTRI